MHIYLLTLAAIRGFWLWDLMSRNKMEGVNRGGGAGEAVVRDPAEGAAGKPAIRRPRGICRPPREEASPVRGKPHEGQAVGPDGHLVSNVARRE